MVSKLFDAQAMPPLRDDKQLLVDLSFAILNRIGGMLSQPVSSNFTGLGGYWDWRTDKGLDDIFRDVGK
jgi:hypothetical protein